MFAGDPAAAAPQVRPALCSVGEVFGGVERHILGLCQFLMRQELDPLVVLFHDRELARQIRALGQEPVILGAGARYSLETPKLLAGVLARRQVNLVHAHGYRAMVNCALANRHFPIGIVRTVHGRVEPRKGNPLAWLKEHLYRTLESMAARHVRAATCYVTDDLARACERKDRGLLRCTIYNGIDPQEKEGLTRPDDLPTGLFNLAIVGRISPVKGIGFALRALLEPDVPESVHLNIIGTGPQQPELEVEARKLGLAGRVHFLGFKDNVNDYLAYCDGLLMPSLHEGLPYVLLEAMALGTPLLASDVAGLAEVLHDKRTALLFPVGDTARIAQAIGRLAASQELALVLGAEARQVQREQFTLERMGMQYWDLYRKSLA